MTTHPKVQIGITPRGAPPHRRPWRRRPVLLAVLALAALVESGCQSDPCNPSPCRRLLNRVFQPRPVITNGCCPGTPIGVPVPLGTPVVPVTPVVPYSSGVVAPPAGRARAPAGAGAGELERIPSASPGPASSIESNPSTGSNPSGGKANYEARNSTSANVASRPQRRAGGATIARSIVSTPAPTPTPEPTSRSAKGSTSSRPSPPPPASASDFSELDNLPPLDIPNIKTHVDPGSPPVAPPAEREKPQVASNPTSPAAADSPDEPGIQRFAGVESKLAGGSLPDPTGLDWLVEKGYRTILDLRENPAATPSFVSDCDRRGLRYVALPISLKTLDSVHIARFHAELAQANARPLYFCDTDGTRAGTLWYIHKVTVDRVDPLVARRDAEEIGLKNDAFWKAAANYLESVRPEPTPVATFPAREVDSTAPPAPSAGPAPAPVSGKPAKQKTS